MVGIRKDDGMMDDYNLCPVFQNGKVGYIQNTGALAIKPRFDIPSLICLPFHACFSEGLALVKTGGKFGYIDKKGRIVIKPRFDYAKSFSEGLAVIGFGCEHGLDSVKGYIDKTGRIIVKPQFDDVGDFSEGLAYIQISDKYGYIDKTGECVIEPRFDSANNFSEGLACASILAISRGVRASKHYLYGYVDKTGEYVIPAQFAQIDDFSEGLAHVALYVRTVNREIYTIAGYIDKMANYKILPAARPCFWSSKFSEGLASVRTYQNKFGYIDRAGGMIIRPQFDYASAFSEGLASVEIDKRWGYIDNAGKMVIVPQFSHASNFSGGLACVQTGDKYGYINEIGDFIWEPTK